MDQAVGSNDTMAVAQLDQRRTYAILDLSDLGFNPVPS